MHTHMQHSHASLTLCGSRSTSSREGWLRMAAIEEVLWPSVPSTKAFPWSNFKIERNIQSKSTKWMSSKKPLVSSLRQSWHLRFAHTHTDTETQRHRHTQTHTDTHRHKQTHTDTHRHKQTHTDTHRHTHLYLLVLAPLPDTGHVVSFYKEAKPGRTAKLETPLDVERPAEAILSDPGTYGRRKYSPTHGLATPQWVGRMGCSPEWWHRASVQGSRLHYPHPLWGDTR